MTSLMCLPNELLVNILGKVNSADYYTLSRVCSRWEGVVHGLARKKILEWIKKTPQLLPQIEREFGWNTDEGMYVFQI